MKKMHDNTMSGRQHGAVLILAMIFMLMIAIVAGTVTQTSILELFMAGNDQSREEAFQQTQGLLNEVSRNVDNFPVAGDIGYTICPSSTECGQTHTVCPATCDGRLEEDPLTLADVPSGVTRRISVVRRGPKTIVSLPFRQREDVVAGVSTFNAAIFEAEAELDGSDVRLGSAHVVQGVVIRFTAYGQRGGVGSGG